jgi:hypothetical protein
MKTKEEKEEVCWTGEHRTVRCHPPDSPVHDPANDLLSRILSSVGYNSSDHPRIALDNPVSQQPIASGHIGPRPMVNKSTGQSGASHRTVWCPLEQESNQSGDSAPCTVHFSVCTG